MLPAFLTTILFSISAVSANRTTRLLGGVEANFWRISLATLLLGGWAHSFGQGLSGKSFPVFLLSGCLGFGLGDTALYQALPRLGSRLSILLVHCLAAPIAAVTEWLWLGTTLTALQMFSSLTILTGVSLALAPSEHLNIARRPLAIGIVFGLIAAFGQGVGAVLSRKAYRIATSAGAPIDGMTAAYQRILAGWIIAALFFWLMKMRARWQDQEPFAETRLQQQWRQAWPWIVFNALSGPTLGVSCYQWALATRPTGIVLPIVAITPLVVIPFAHVLEGEHPTARSLVGGVLAVAGAVALTVFK